LNGYGLKYWFSGFAMVLGVGWITLGLASVGNTAIAVLGIASALIGIVLIHDTAFNQKPRRKWALQKPWRKWAPALASLAIYLVPLIALVWYEQMPALVIVSLACASAVGLALLAAALRTLFEDGDDGGDPGWIREWILNPVGLSFWVGLALSVAGVVGVWRAGDNDFLFIVSFAVLFLGVVLWGFALVVSCQDPENALIWATASWAFLLVAMAGAVVLAAREADPLLLAIPAVIAGIALIPLSQATPHLLKAEPWGMRSFRFLAIGVMGAALGAVSTVLFTGEAWSVGLTIVVVAGLAMLALAYVLDVSALALFLLVVVVLAGVMIDRTGGQLASDGDATLVVFGDSYISGEGAYEFLEGTNVAVSDGDSSPTSNECRRAASAYPNLLAASKNWALETYACSGARTMDIADLSNGPTTRKPSTQLEEFESNGGTDDKKIAAVLISIGGNDAWFGALGQACLGPGSCEVHRDSVMRNLREVGARVGETFEAVKAAVGYPNVPIYAIPYPLVMTRTGCEDSPLTNAEQEFLFEFSEKLNDTIRVEAERADINWVAPAIAAQAKHRMCESEDLSVNIVDVLPKEGPLSARIIPTNWVKGSAHPHEAGHELTFKAIKPVFDGALVNTQTDVVRLSPIRPELVPVSRGALGIPANRNCGDQDVPVSLTVQSATTNSDPELPDIAESSPLCTNLEDGGPVRWETYDAAGRDVSWDKAIAVAVPEDERPEFHWVTYKTEAGNWTAVVYQYCDLRPDCVDSEADLKTWMQGEVEATVRSSVVPAVLVFAALWLGFMWLKVRGGLPSTWLGSMWLKVRARSPSNGTDGNA
jgi:hypothetical protein